MNESKTSSTYDFIKSKIIHNEISPMEDISERAIQEELGVSRTPIREALLQLEADGFVQIFPRKGIIATPISFKMISDLYDAREIFEPKAFVKAIPHLSTEWFEQMLFDLEEVSKSERKEEIFDFDDYFHKAIISSCQNTFIIGGLMPIYDHFQRFRYIGGQYNAALRNSQKQHLEILNALQEGDSEKVETAVNNHLQHSKSATLKNFNLT